MGVLKKMCGTTSPGEEKGKLERPLRDVAVAIAWSRTLEQKLRKAKWCQLQFF